MNKLFIKYFILRHQEFSQKYPSHLHIDLLPIAQGKGLGNNMMDHFMKYLIKQGSTGVHLGLGIKTNEPFTFIRNME